MPWTKTGNLRGPAGERGPEGPAGGASGDIIKIGDQAVTVTAQTALAGLSYPVTAAGVYYFRASLYVFTAATTTGARPGVLFTGTAPSRNAYRTDTPASATTDSISHGTPGAATASTSTSMVIVVEGFASYGAGASGAITLSMASEVAGSAVNVLTGSVMSVKKVA